MASDSTVGRLREHPPDLFDFDTIYQQHSGWMYALACRWLSAPAEAEDAMQDTFLTFYRRAPQIEHPSKIGAWLKRVLINTCIDRLKNAKKHRAEELRADASDGAPAHNELEIDLAEVTARLPEKLRQVFLLHDVEGFTHREVAEFMGITDGTSKSQLFHARRFLRKQITAERRGAR